MKKKRDDGHYLNGGETTITLSEERVIKVNMEDRCFQLILDDSIGKNSPVVMIPNTADLEFEFTIKKDFYSAEQVEFYGKATKQKPSSIKLETIDAEKHTTRITYIYPEGSISFEGLTMDIVIFEGGTVEFKNFLLTSIKITE